MGCITSVPEHEGPSEDMMVKLQRRRLSVTPEHVGNINPENKTTIPKQLEGNDKNEKEMKFAVQTKKGYVPYNDRKKNQDSYIVQHHVNRDPNISIFGVFDGHGEIGHNVSNFCSESLASFIEAEDTLRSDPSQAIINGTRNLCKSLEHRPFNLQYSGTTSVYTLQIDKTLYTANIGDSRFIIARKNSEGNLIPEQISRDHRPELPDEKERILKAGGRIETLHGLPGEDCGPLRVWLQNIDVPGLAMSRSIGDQVSHTVGVIDIPEITVTNIDENVVFGVWATDGVWEFLSNEKVVEIVNKYYPDLFRCVHELCETAKRCWMSEEEVIDDITAVIVAF